MDKKTYESPVVKKVSLDIKNSVLAVCQSSTNPYPGDECRIIEACAYGAG